MLIGRVRLSCVIVGTSGYWSKERYNAILAINTKCIRLHDDTPAEIIVGFNLLTQRRAEGSLENWTKRNLDEDMRGAEGEELDLDSFIDVTGGTL